MNLMNLVDGPSALIVFGGTLVATLLRSGLGDCRHTVMKLGQLAGGSRFDVEAARAELAQQAQEIRRDGLIRAVPHTYRDRELDEATDVMIGAQSVDALLDAHERHKARRQDERDRAVRTLAQAAELAPVSGLAGTLISLSQLPAAGLANGSFTGAIAMAVLTTLYGLLAANLVLAPLALLVERRTQAEETARQELIEWLVRQVSEAGPARQLRERLRHELHAEAS